MTNIRKLLGGVSFIVVLLLNQPITWAQGFGDDVKIEASYCAVTPIKATATGSPANDYNVNLNPPLFRCTIPGTKLKQSFTLSGHAALGAGLGIFGSSQVAGPAASDGTTVVANDTLVLNPPVGFTGTSVEIGLKQTYTLKLQGATGHNMGNATACFKWTGRITPTCFPLATNGVVTETLTFSPIVVKKTNIGFRLNIELTGDASVVTVTGSQVSASVTIGSPLFTLPNKDWTSTWLSGEP
jgi:hypothetical protein